MQQTRQLGARSRLARAVQPHHQHATRVAAQHQPGVLRAEQIHHFIVNDFDNLLAGLNALDHFLADGLGFNALDEIPGHLEIDVRFQQRQAHLAQGLPNVGFGDFPQPAQVPKGVLEFVAERIEHLLNLEYVDGLDKAAPLRLLRLECHLDTTTKARNSRRYGAPKNWPAKCSLNFTCHFSVRVHLARFCSKTGYFGRLRLATNQTNHLDFSGRRSFYTTGSQWSHFFMFLHSFFIPVLRSATRILGGGLLLTPFFARAGSAFFDFNTDPTANALLAIYGNASWLPTGGAGTATNLNDGYLQITPSAGGQRGAVVFADFDTGAIIKAFTFEADVRIGNGSATPADGFS